MISSPISSRALIGREDELSALIERRRAAFAGHGSLVLVEGEAGIGKSRLLREFRATLTHGRALHVSAAAFPYAGRPYGPALDALDELLRSVPDALHNATELQATLVTVFPRLVTAEARASAGADKHALFEAITSAFVAIARKRATVVLIEDLHWADQGTLELLLYLTRVVEATRLLFAVSYRSDELHRAHPLVPAIARLGASPAVHRITLRPLEPASTRALIHALLEGRDALPPQVEFDIERRSEGNPFFVEELLKSVLERTERRQGTRDLPLSIRGTVLERLNYFESTERDILVRAAVIGRRFKAGFVARTLGVTTESLYPALVRARDLQLIVEVDPTTPDLFDFRHALIREAIYEELLTSQAQALHTKVATALETLPEPRSVSDLAYHWWKAGDNRKSVLYNDQAGDAAVEVHADEDAIVHYDRAVEMLQRQQTAGHSTEGGTSEVAQQIADLNRKIANAMFRLGRPDAALPTFERAITYYRRAGDPKTLWAIYQSAARSLYNAGRPKVAISTLRDALATLSEQSQPQVADDARALLASFLTDGGEHKEALNVLAAIRSQSLSDDADLRFLVHHTQALANALDGNIDTWRNEVNELRSAAAAVNERGPLIGFFDETALTASCLAERETSEEFFEAALAMARAKQVPVYVSFIAIDYAFEKYLRGRLNEALALLDEALGVHHDMSVVRIRLAIAGLAIGTACADELLISRSFDTLCVEEAFATGKGDFFGPLAALYARRAALQGKHEEARVLLNRAARQLRQLYGTFPLLPMIGAYADPADIELARKTLGEEQHASSQVVQATRALFEAHKEQRFGDPAVAQREARLAARAFGAIGWPIYEAQGLEVAGELQAAAQIYRRIGAAGEARRLELKVQQPAASKPASPAAVPGGLSKREWQIAHLAAQGKGNRLIAHELHIAEKTVEHHMSSILEKSGFRSRTELAAYVAALDRGRQD